MCPHPNLIINDETWWQKNSKATHVIIIVYAWSTIILEMHLCNHCSVTKREGPYSPRLDDRTPDDNTRLQVQHSHTEYTRNFTCENSSCFNYWTYTSESTSSLDRPPACIWPPPTFSLFSKGFLQQNNLHRLPDAAKKFGNQQILFYHSSNMLPPSLLFLLTLFYSLLYFLTLPLLLFYLLPYSSFSPPVILVLHAPVGFSFKLSSPQTAIPFLLADLAINSCRPPSTNSISSHEDAPPFLHTTHTKRNKNSMHPMQD